jgi:adenine deaminase
VIEIVPGQILTGRSVQPVAREGDLAVADPERDLLKIAVLDRYSGSGRVGAGFVHGLGLRHGAVASSVAHDSHNIIVAGADDADMQAAVAAVAETGGGLAVVDGGRLRARLPLPIAGLMSDQPLETVANQLDVLGQAARELGCRLPDPFMTLSFLALPVIPQLKITDRGLIDVETFAPIPLFV